MRALPILLCSTLVACGGTGEPRGNVVAAEGSGGTRSYAVHGFTAVQVAGTDDVEVRTGSDFSVAATAEPALLDRLEVRRDGELLRIGRQADDWSWSSGEGARILVTMPELRSGEVVGSGNLTIDRAEDGFNGSIAGSGDLTIGMLDGGTAAFEIAGSGTLAAAGQVALLKASIAGPGDLDGQQLKAQAAEIAITGSGNIHAQVNGPAEVSLAGSGDADLGENARCRVRKAGSGEARCGQML